MKAISPKPPKIQTANGTAICWGHDVIECEDCRETITWCSRCVEESSLRLAVKQSQFSEFFLFFPADIAFIRCRSMFVPFRRQKNQRPSWYVLGCFSLNKIPEKSITRTILMTCLESLEHIDQGIFIFCFLIGTF